jgi:co-chaperonin GroES (HSP10)
MSKALADLKAIGNKIIFQFCQETYGGQFHSTTRHGIVIMENADKQLASARWAKVVKTGPRVTDDIKVGDYVLIESLQWTTHQVWNKEKFWMTTDEKILAVSDVKPDSI